MGQTRSSPRLERHDRRRGARGSRRLPWRLRRLACLKRHDRVMDERGHAGIADAHPRMRMEGSMPATRSTQRARTRPSGKRATNLSLSSDVLEAPGNSTSTFPRSAIPTGVSLCAASRSASGARIMPILSLPTMRPLKQKACRSKRGEIFDGAFRRLCQYGRSR